MKVISKSCDCCIEKEVLTRGILSKRPTERSKCRVRIEGMNFGSIDEALPSEYLKPANEEMVVTIGDANSKVDEYVERLIQTMFINESSLAKITITIANNDVVSLDFKITLIDCEWRKPIWEWSAKEKYEVALSYKESGVSLYKSMRIVEAFMKFSRACKILISLEPIEDLEMEETVRKDIDNLRKVLYNNMAECHLIRKNYEHTVSLCDKVLNRDENNVKALWRKAVANEKMRDYEKALEYMEKVVVLEPKNSAAKERLAIYRKYVFQAKKRYDNIVKKMFKLDG